MDRVRVSLRAADPLTLAGLTAALASRAEVQVVDDNEQVEVLVSDRFSCDVVTRLRRLALDAGKPVVLVISEITETELLTAVECRVVAVVPRAGATAERIVRSVQIAASGGAAMPPQLVGDLLKHVERLQREVLSPHGLNISGLTPREVDVLRLMADGMDTAQIAGTLHHSERTVKNVIYGVTSRLKLRNRSHAVAYALRAGMI